LLGVWFWGLWVFLSPPLGRAGRVFIELESEAFTLSE
jgi:hypothetical protein